MIVIVIEVGRRRGGFDYDYRCADYEHEHNDRCSYYEHERDLFLDRLATCLTV